MPEALSLDQNREREVGGNKRLRLRPNVKVARRPGLEKD